MPRSEKDRRSHELGKQLGDCADSLGRDFAQEIQDLIRSTDAEQLLSAEGRGLLTLIMQDYALEVIREGVKVALRNRLVRDTISKAAHRAAGKRSGEIRGQRGHKHKFLEWALELNRTNPGISKNAVAARYAREHPGASVTTLRKYLSEIPNEIPEKGVD